MRGAAATSVGVPGKMAAAVGGSGPAGSALCLLLLCASAMATRGPDGPGELGGEPGEPPRPCGSGAVPEGGREAPGGAAAVGQREPFPGGFLPQKSLRPGSGSRLFINFGVCVSWASCGSWAWWSWRLGAVQGLGGSVMGSIRHHHAPWFVLLNPVPYLFVVFSLLIFTENSRISFC